MAKPQYKPNAIKPKILARLTPSWDLVGPSVQLIRQNIDTMLWLIILPAVLSLLATQLINPFVAALSQNLGDQPTNAQLHTAFRIFADQLTHTSRGQTAILLLCISTLWTLIVYPATVVFMLQAARKKSTDLISCLRGGWKSFWRIYAVSLLVGVVVLGGLILFIIPGLFLLRRYVLAPFYAADRGLGVLAAMRASAVETKPYAGYVWGMLGVYFSFIILSGLFDSIPVIGGFVGFAVSYIFFFGPALRYKTVVDATKSALKTAEK